MDWNHVRNLCDFQYLILYQIGVENYYHWATNVWKCDVVEVVIVPPSSSTIKFSQIWLFTKYGRQILKHAYTFFSYLLEPSVEMWWCLKVFLIQFFKHCFPQKTIEFATISSWIFATLWNIAHKWPFSFWATS
jgi:hypothetical protein